MNLEQYKKRFCEYKHKCEAQENVIWVNQTNEYFLDNVIRATEEIVKMRIYFCPWCGKELL